MEEYILFKKLRRFGCVQILAEPVKTSTRRYGQNGRVFNAIRNTLVGFHGFRTRKAGSRFFVDFHVEIRGVESFERAHEITEDLIERLGARFPNADFTVHCDPEGTR